jgi:phosphatidyl-myo-inositol alpha-mannosyltransferase
VRLLLSCPYAWEAPGGVQVHVRELAERLESSGHEVLVIAPGSRRPPEPWVRIVGRPVRVPYRGTVAPISFSLGSWRRIREIVRVFEPELLHAHEPLTPSTSMLAVSASTAPVVATFHAYLDRSRLMELAAPALRTVARRIDARIAVSQAAATFVERAIPADVEIVPNGLDVARFAHPGPPARGLPPGRVLLWVGRLDRQKGFRVMVHAFERLASSDPQVALVVIGSGRDGDAVELLTPDARRRVLMLGAVEHDRLPAYHAAASVFASAATGQESFGYVMVEAMAAGVPVVATDILGYREVVRDEVDGLLVAPNDPVALSDAIRRVLVDPALAERLRSAGRARAAEFSWDVVLPRIEAIYRRVAEGPR